MGQAMGGRGSGGLATAEKCIFCGAPDLVEARIWPDWLDHIIPKETYLQAEGVAEQAGCPLPATRIDLTAPLSQRPRLACNACNNGWISELGAEVRLFLEPALSGQAVLVDAAQAKVLAGWLCLLATTTAFARHNCGISPGDRGFLRHTKQPTRSWGIFVAGLNGDAWSKACAHHPYRIEFSGNPMATHSRGGITECNTQLLSFGMGPLFFHIFSSPSLLLQSEFAHKSRTQGLSQLWPPERRFGLLPPRPVRLPPDLQLTDAEAWRITDLFADLLRHRLPGRRPSRSARQSAA